MTPADTVDLGRSSDRDDALKLQASLGIPFAGVDTLMARRRDLGTFVGAGVLLREAARWGA